MVGRNAERQTAGRQARMASLLGLSALAGIAIAATANAANVSEVRVGTHDKSTRIVLELDQASGYRLVTPKDGSNPELVIQLDAASVARDVPSKSPLVRKVHVEPTSGGSTVHVRLATSNVAVKELLLASPPRLVFDLTAQGPIPKAPADEETASESAEPAHDAPPVAIAAAPAPVPPPAKVEEPKPAPEPPKLAAEPSPAPHATDAAPAPAAKPSMPPAPIAAAEPPKPIDVPASSEPGVPTVRETPPPRPPSPIASSIEARHKAIAEKEAPAFGSSLMSLATSPIGLGAIAATVLLVGAIVVMRRRRGDEDEESIYSVMASETGVGAQADDEDESRPEPVRSAPIWEPDAFDASEPAPKHGPHQLSLGARPAPEPVVAESAEPSDTDLGSIFGAEPEPGESVAPVATEPSELALEPTLASAAPAPIPVVAASEETERRIAELERRIEQLAEARERLERQVAAQTEELRVQRAAIARTQRVVRSIAKTEDLATEPVPRAPSMS